MFQIKLLSQLCLFFFLNKSPTQCIRENKTYNDVIKSIKPLLGKKWFLLHYSIPGNNIFPLTF